MASCHAHHPQIQRSTKSTLCIASCYAHCPRTQAEEGVLTSIESPCFTVAEEEGDVVTPGPATAKSTVPILSAAVGDEDAATPALAPITSANEEEEVTPLRRRPHRPRLS
jgi:hypothetical protein